MDGEILKAAAGLGGVPIIMIVVSSLKPFIADTRVYPILAILTGVALNLGLLWLLPVLGRAEVVAAVLQGIMAGAAAGGLWTGVNTFKEGKAAINPKPKPPA